MASEAVVIGGGPGGVRAAAALAGAGRAVVLLQIGPVAGGVQETGMPIGRGLTPSPPASGEALVGPSRPIDGLDRAVLLEGAVRPLPLHRAEIARMLPVAGVVPAGIAWARTRGAVELKKLIGGGNELRTYEDWIVQRHGKPVFDALYAAYCRKRFGDPAEISCNVARLFHGFGEGPRLAAPPDIVAAGALTGVKIVTGCAIRSIGRGVVETDAGAFSGDVYLDVPPSRAAAWLEAGVGESLRNELALLCARDAVQVLVRGPQDLPFETHVLDATVPFYRVTRPGALPGWERLAGTLAAHFTAAEDDATPASEWVGRTVEGLGRAGIKGVDGEGALVQRVPWQHPVWAGTHLVRMRTYVIALEELEITPVGRAGLHSPLTLAAELAYLDGLLAEDRPSIRELVRLHVEPPVMDPVERVHLTRFVER